MFGPNDTPGYLGFSPRPQPRLIATHRTHGPALSISKGIDRDRAVDESGNQLSVFNRRGAGPLTFDQTRRMYIHPENGRYYTVTNEPPRGNSSSTAAAAR
jgi:hypothetical protein